MKYTAPQTSRRVDSEFRDRVRSSAEGHWHLLLQRIGVPGSLLTGEAVSCPECGGSFRFLDARDRGSFVCRGSGRPDAAGDGFALVMHLGGLTFGDAVRAVGEAVGHRALPRHTPRRFSDWRGVA
jgi:phage/plasmid primase-like uncharacterized protein